MKRLGLSILLLLASLVAFATAQSASGATAYYSDFDLVNNNWNFTASKVSCASALANTSLEWRKEYGWTMYCSSNDPHPGEAICGKCLKVTNTETGVQEKVRIFDACAGDYLVMDRHTAFHQLKETSKEGYNKGRLTVDYEFVDCEDVRLVRPVRPPPARPPPVRPPPVRPPPVPPVRPPPVPPVRPDESNVEVRWAYYQAKEHDYANIPAACSLRLANKPYEFRSKYNWTAFHGLPDYPMPDSCGKCIKVTNTANTSAEITVRIVDVSGLGLVMDEPGFDAIDFNGWGRHQGHLLADYKFVDCGDSEKNIVLVSSL